MKMLSDSEITNDSELSSMETGINDYDACWERYGGKLNWELTRATVLMRDEFVCRLCLTRKKSHELRVHHMLPLSKGGTNELTNLITLCSKCHKRLHPENSKVF